MAIMYKPNLAGFINQHLRGHSSQFEYLDLLTIQFQNQMFGIRQTDKRQIFFCPVIPESFDFFRPGNDDFRIQIYKFLIILAQLRHVRAAEGSEKSAVENHHHIFFVFIVGKRDALAVEIIQRKIRCLNI